MPKKQTRLVFFGHDFFGDDRARKYLYRTQITNGVAEANAHRIVKSKRIKYHAIYGDSTRAEDRVLAKHLPKETHNHYYWFKIRDRIHISHTHVFDLTGREKETLNYNVILELGVAYGERKEGFVLCTDRKLVQKHLTNLWGNQISEYSDTRSFRDLPTEVRNILLLDAEI